MNVETQALEALPVIQMTKVDSSQIDAIGHDAATETLAVKFPPTKSQPEGSLYHYANFNETEYAKFMAAESKGSYHGKYIKPFKDKYPYTRIS